MKTIQVHKPFVLTLDDHTQLPFAAGTHEVDDAIASHWYVRAHSTVPAEAPKAADAAKAEADKNSASAKK